MRFIGNKEAIAPVIREMLEEKGLLHRNLTIFDACCGTGRWTRLATEALAAKTDDVPDEAAAVEEVIAKLESYAKRVVRPYHQALTKALL